MTARQLPERPNLDQLKRQAKDLLRAARAHDAAALARFRTCRRSRTTPTEIWRPRSLGLHDAQSVVAREYGLDSWNALRERVEELTLEFGAAADRFIEAATDGRADRAERLLALHPGIARANVYAALVLGDAEAVERRIAEHPGLPPSAADHAAGSRCTTSATRRSARARTRGKPAWSRLLAG